eukprot:TRINITY_DN240_c0_g1_i1.p2 TRINITY_DN240_c0_g1~~TRINITY_DN240_c0_g1_i1.p2  ORF type:complete len:495 (+),score=86.57 TRINITY_DN240_c0_g1_i1:208-1692(+)
MQSIVAFTTPSLLLSYAPSHRIARHDARFGTTAVLAPRPPRRRVRPVAAPGESRIPPRKRRSASASPAIRIEQTRSSTARRNAAQQAAARARRSPSSPTRRRSTQPVVEAQANIDDSHQMMRDAYLQEQLLKRQRENSARKQAVVAKARRTQKRMRSPSRPRTRNVTSALKDTFQMYMEEISRNDLLLQAQVNELAAQIKAAVAVENVKRSLQRTLGRRPSVNELAQQLQTSPPEIRRIVLKGTAAKNTLVSANLRLVTSVARKVASAKAGGGIGIALDDMVQEGSVGLIRAAEKFDASRGYRFSTYATWWIRAYVMRSITTQSRSIKVPGTVVDEYARIRKEYSRLRESGIARPTEEEVAKQLGITAAKLRFVVNVVTRKPISLDLSLGPADDPSGSRFLGEIVEGDDQVEEKLVETYQRQELDMALRQCLRPLERAVIRLRFGLEDGQPRTLRETGELLGLSKERIRQLIFRALPKMKTPEIQRMLTDAASR